MTRTSHSDGLPFVTGAAAARQNCVLRLSPEQQTAAESSARLLRIIAGPGSGKSSVAAYRFGLHRFHTHDERAVIGLSFTRAAARVLHQRVNDRWGSAALTWRHKVITVDELNRMALEHLVLTRVVDWPMAADAALEIIDAWSEDDGAVAVGRNTRVWTAGIAAGVVCSRQTFWKATYGKALRDEELHSTALKSGRCTHNDVRNIIRDVLADARFKAALVTWVQRTFKAFIVDEAYDSNEDDTAMIRVLAEAGVAVTLVGDEWQALYEFRGAVPGMLARTADSLGFRKVEMLSSYRFTPELYAVARDLREGGRVELTIMEPTTEVDIVLCHDWATLWDLGSAILPLAIGGNPKTALDAVLTLILDVLVHEQLGVRAVFKSEAERMLRIAASEGNDAPRADIIRTVEAMAEKPLNLLGLRDSLDWDLDRDVRRRILRSDTMARAKAKNFRVLKERIEATYSVGGRRPSPGTTVHQAKGREWDSVILVAKGKTWTALQGPLDVDTDSHRVLYVGMTRARAELSVIRVPTAEERRSTQHDSTAAQLISAAGWCQFSVRPRAEALTGRTGSE